MAVHPYGATLGYDLSSPYATYISLAEVIAIGGPDSSVGDTQTTHLTSTSAHHTYVAGMVKAGQISLKLHMTKAEVTVLFDSLLKARLTAGFKITYPLVGAESTGSAWTFTGHVNKATIDEFDVDGDETIKVSASIMITGVATFTAGS